MVFKSFENILSLKYVIEKSIHICEVLICIGTGAGQAAIYGN